MLIQIIGVGMAIMCFAILLETPKKYLPVAALVGALSGGIYLLFLEAGVADFMSSFLSAFAITCVSNIIAKIMKAPVTVFLIAGILPTVPGAGMYKTVYYMIMSDSESSSYYLVETLKVAGAISLGIFMAETIFRSKRKKEREKQCQKK